MKIKQERKHWKTPFSFLFSLFTANLECQEEVWWQIWKPPCLSFPSSYIRDLGAAREFPAFWTRSCLKSRESHISLVPLMRLQGGRCLSLGQGWCPCSVIPSQVATTLDTGKGCSELDTETYRKVDTFFKMHVCVCERMLQVQFSFAMWWKVIGQGRNASCFLYHSL